MKRPLLSGVLTFLVSLKWPGPKDLPVECFIKQDRTAGIVVDHPIDWSLRSLLEITLCIGRICSLHSGDSIYERGRPCHWMLASIKLHKKVEESEIVVWNCVGIRAIDY